MVMTMVKDAMMDEGVEIAFLYILRRSRWYDCNNPTTEY